MGNRVLKESQKIIERGSQGLYVVSGVFVVCLAVLVTYATLSRYLFNRAISATEELAALLLVGCAFLALAHVFVKGGHISVTLITSKLPWKVRQWVELMAGVITLFYLVVFLKESYQFTYRSYLLDCHSLNAHLYEVPWMALMPLGTGVFILTVLLFCIKKGLEIGVALEKAEKQNN